MGTGTLWWLRGADGESVRHSCRLEARLLEWLEVKPSAQQSVLLL